MIQLLYFQEPSNGTPSLLVISCLFGVFTLLLMLILATAIRIVPQHKRLVIFRLGRFTGAPGPGVIIMLPMLDRGVEVDLRERLDKLEKFPVLTANAIPLRIDLLWGHRVLDPAAYVLNVADFETAIQEVLAAVLRSTFAETDFANLLRERRQVTDQLRERLGVMVADWGVEITKLELQDIQREVQ